MTLAPSTFDQKAAAWDENPVRIQLAQNIAAAIRRNVVITADMTALDFGCGTGLLTFELADTVTSVTGADTSQAMLDVLMSKAYARKQTNVHALALTMERSWPATYDLVVSSMALHHVEKTAALIADLFRALKPSGTLCIADLDAEDGSFHDDSTGVYHAGFDRATLRACFHDAGFSSVFDETATTLTKPTRTGLRTFPIFLMIGKKAIT